MKQTAKEHGGEVFVRGAHRRVARMFALCGADLDLAEPSERGEAPVAQDLLWSAEVAQDLLWSAEYAIGFDEIDAQHRDIFLLHNDLVHAVERGVSLHARTNILMELVRYAEHHFEAEHRLMERLRYPGVTQHLVSHHGFDAYAARLRDPGADSGVIADAVRYIRGWITSHILVEDRDIARFAQAAA